MTDRPPQTASERRWELRDMIAMAICGAPDIGMDMSLRAYPCVCKRDNRPVSESVPRCLYCLLKADAALRILDLLEQDSHPKG